MAASTVTASTANKQSLYRKLQRITTQRHVRPTKPAGLFYLEASVTVATTSIDEAGDEVTILEFPDSTYLWDLQVQMTDMDTNGSPALVVDFNEETSGGTETTLINNTTIGQAGGFDELDGNLGFKGRDVSNTTLRMKVVTAAGTAAAGTLTVRALVLVDKVASW